MASYRGTVFKITGILSMLFSLTMILPILVALFYNDGEFKDFAISLIFFLVAGLLLYSSGSTKTLELSRRDGFVVVVLFWIILSVLGTVPFIFALHVSFTDALFESASGLTTTGATVLTYLDKMPPSLLLYRQQLQ